MSVHASAGARCRLARQVLRELGQSPATIHRQTHEMLTALLDAHDIDERLAALVIEKSDGVPFFIEEMVKTL